MLREENLWKVFENGAVGEYVRLGKRRMGKIT
jgi:hypothetical protein